MKCAEVMSAELAWIPGSASVMAAAGAMRDRSLGLLLVRDPIPGHAIGVVTDRDLAIRVCAESLNPVETRVGSVATIGVVVCNENDDLETAEEKMAETQQSRLAVIDKGGQIVGVLSLTDILRSDRPRRAVRTANAVNQRGPNGPRPGWEGIQLTPSTVEDEERAAHQDTVLTGGHHHGSMKEFPNDST